MPDPAPEPTPTGDAAIGTLSMIEQACAIAIQDAVAYLRNTEIIANAAIGAALALAQSDSARREATQVIAMAQSTVAAAVKNLEDVGAAAAKTLQEFPRAIP